MIRAAHDQLTQFMRMQIAERRSEIRSGSKTPGQRNDIFSMLVQANEEEAGKLRLDDQELVGLPMTILEWRLNLFDTL